MIAEFGEVEAVGGHDRGHSGAAVGARNFHAIGRGIDDTGAIGNGFVDFGGRDVLAFPAESIADPVDEMEEAGFIELHQVAGAKPGVAISDHVAQDFVLGLAASV